MLVRIDAHRMKPIYIAAYHQSKFGKLLAVTQEQMIASAVSGVCAEIGITPTCSTPAPLPQLAISLCTSRA
jgi:hypothetical protein